MSPLTILIIRHAEKPKEKWPGPGLNINGQPDKKSLVIRGWQRAGAWAALFETAPSTGDYPRPAAIFAAKPDEDDEGDDPSQRPYETVVPLSAKLGLTPAIDIAKGAEAALADRIQRLTGTVLVCWEHKTIISGLLPALKGDQDIPNLPIAWDNTRYDVALRLDRAGPVAPWSFRQLFPQLLSEDSDVSL